MVERESAAGRQAEESVAHTTSLDPEAAHGGTATKRARLEPRPDKGLPFAEALDEAMRDHRAVFAALAK